MKELFAAIAGRYDAMNRIMSLGTDVLWRRAALRGISLPQGSAVLDLACGTGDFTVELSERWPYSRITGVDLTPQMLDIARLKLAGRRNVTLLQGDAQDLTAIGPGSCSLVVCAFGFRNFPDKAKALSECNRVLVTGGRLVVLELFRPESKILGTIVNAWLSTVSCLFASGARNEYRYLRRSVAGTVSAAQFTETARQAGFTKERKRFILPAVTCITFVKRGHRVHSVPQGNTIRKPIVAG